MGVFALVAERKAAKPAKLLAANETAPGSALTLTRGLATIGTLGAAMMTKTQFTQTRPAVH